MVKEVIVMFRKLRPFLSAGIAALLAVETAVQPVFSAEEQTIETISFSNVSTSLTIGTAPDFTAYLDGDTLLHASILNEGWSCISDSSAYAVKSDGLPIPDEPTGVPYRYALALTADSGWYFPEYITLYYEGNLIDSRQYTASVRNEGKNLILYCDFIPHVTPLAPDAQAISAAYIVDAVLDYCAGESPRFTARPADPSQFEIVYERWADVQNPECFVTSSEQFNAEMALTDENRLTVFEAGRQYHYDICIAAKYGYSFSDDAGVYVNGTPCTVFGHPADSIPVNDVCVITVKEAQTTMPVVTTAKPVTTTAKPVTTTAKPVTTTAKPVTTTAKPVTTTVKTTSKPATSAEPDPDLLYGDVNQDGVLSIADAVLLMRLLTEDPWISLSNEGQLAGDVNLDGILTILDCTALLRLIALSPDIPELPPQPAEADGSETEIPDSGDFTWLGVPAGNSAAFTEKPFDALTVTAEENVLSYDGQLQFSELTQEDFEEAETLLGDDPALLLDGWNLEAGLKPDEHLPGFYSCTYDLSQLGIPEALYENIRLLRVADDGNVTEYLTECDGALLRWESDQNSTTLVVLVSILVVESCVGIYKLSQNTDKIWSDEEEKAPLKWAKTSYCYIRYADLEAAPEDAEREERMKMAYNHAKEAVRQKAQEEVEHEWIAWAYDTVGFKLKVNRKIAKLADEYLQNNADYQADLKVKNGVPADVALVAEQFKRAYFYLRFEEGCPTLGSTKPAIYFGEAVKGDGFAYNPTFGPQYICLQRTTNKCKHVAADTPFGDIYKTIIPAEKADRYLITLTHELYHIYQNLKLSTHVKNYLKFSEMSAAVIEHRAGDFYLTDDKDTFTAYEETITDKYETYGLPLEEHGKSKDILIPAGYTLSHFWEYLETCKKKKLKGWEMILAFEKNRSILKTLNDIYGFESQPGTNPYIVLGAYWKAFQKKMGEKELTRAAQVEQHRRNENYEDDNVVNFFPSLMHIVKIGSDRTQVHLDVGYQDFTCTQTVLRSKTGNWSVILVRDKDFGRNQSAHTFLIPDGTDGKPIGNETKKGTVMVSAKPDLHYREIQCAGTVGKSGYTAHFIPAPETPQVSYNAETEQFTVKLQSAPSEEGASGLTDRFLLICRVDGNETAAIPVEFAGWQKELTLSTADLHLNIRRKCRLQITVCEAIDASDKFAEGRCAMAKPFEMDFGTLDFPIINQDLSVDGSYGCVSVSRNSVAHFTLDASGNFTFELEAGAGADDPLREKDPLSLESEKWQYSGFTVSGKVTDAESSTNWTAKIISCSAGTFSAFWREDYKEWYDEDGDGDMDEHIMHQENEWSGAFEGAPSGTLKFTEKEGTGKVSIVLSLDVPQLTGTKETETVNSVRLSGSFKIS